MSLIKCILPFWLGIGYRMWRGVCVGAGWEGTHAVFHEEEAPCCQTIRAGSFCVLRFDHIQKHISTDVKRSQCPHSQTHGHFSTEPLHRQPLSPVSWGKGKSVSSPRARWMLFTSPSSVKRALRSVCQLAVNHLTMWKPQLSVFTYTCAPNAARTLVKQKHRIIGTKKCAGATSKTRWKVFHIYLLIGFLSPSLCTSALLYI